MTSPAPTPEVIQVIERFRGRVLAVDAAAGAEMVAAYGPIWQRVSVEVDTLLAQAETLTLAQVKRLQRWQALQLQIEREVGQFATMANGVITEAQRVSVGLSEQGTRQVVDAALPPGINTRVLARIGIEWNALPTEAFETFVGIAGDGSPLSNLLDPLGIQVRQGVTDAIGEGISLGMGPRKTAALVRNPERRLWPEKSAAL